MTRSYQPTGYCPHCGYRMDAGVCPECGRTVRRPAKLHPRARRRRRVIRALFAISALLALGGAGVHYRDELAVRFWPTWHLRQIADQNDRLSPWAERILDRRWKQQLAAERPRMRARQERVLSELERSGDHDWAGDYAGWAHIFIPRVWTTPRYENLLLAPDSGFVWHHGEDGFNHGEVAEATEERLILAPIIDPALERLSWAPTCTELIRVRWGQCRILMRPENMLDFCNGVNAGSGLGLFGPERAKGDLERKPGGDPPEGLFPEVPREYRRFILPEPITGHVAEVRADPIRPGTAEYDPTCEGHYVELTLDVGSQAGVYGGLCFYAQFETYLDAMDVSTVSARSCILWCWLYGEPSESGTWPALGAEYCTRASWGEHPETSQPAMAPWKGELP